MARRGPQSFRLHLGGSYVDAEARHLNDGGLLIQARSYALLRSESVFLRFTWEQLPQGAATWTLRLGTSMMWGCSSRHAPVLCSGGSCPCMLPATASRSRAS